MRDDDFTPPPKYFAVARLRPESPFDTWAQAIAGRRPLVVEVDAKALAECVPALVEALLAAYRQHETPNSEERES